MTTVTRAKGSATRTANKIKRRERILHCAGDIIATEGFEALTLNRLAEKAEVTIPTIHNLIGKKSDIYTLLVDQMVGHIEAALSALNTSDTILAAETFIDNLMALFSSNESLYKAAFVAGERSHLFDQGLADGIFQRSLTIAEQVCARAATQGDLKGGIATGLLARQLFAAQRLARHDWMHGYIDLPQYRTQVLTSMFVTLAADAAPAFHARLMEKIQLYARKGLS